MVGCSVKTNQFVCLVRHGEWEPKTGGTGRDGLAVVEGAPDRAGRTELDMVTCEFGIDSDEYVDWMFESNRLQIVCIHALADILTRQWRTYGLGVEPGGAL